MGLTATVDIYGQVTLTVIGMTPTGWTKSDGNGQLVACSPESLGSGVYIDRRPQTNYTFVSGQRTSFTFTGTDFLLRTRDAALYDAEAEYPDQWDFWATRVTVDSVDFLMPNKPTQDRYEEKMGIETTDRMLYGQHGLTNTLHTVSCSSTWPISGYWWNNFNVLFGAEVTYEVTDGVDTFEITVSPEPDRREAILHEFELSEVSLEDFPDNNRWSPGDVMLGQQFAWGALAYLITRDTAWLTRTKAVFNYMETNNEFVIPSNEQQFGPGWVAYNLMMAYKITGDTDYLDQACAYVDAFLNDWGRDATYPNILSWIKNQSYKAVTHNHNLATIFSMALVYNEPEVANRPGYGALYQSSGLLTIIEATFDWTLDVMNHISADGAHIYYGVGPVLAEETLFYSLLSFPYIHYLSEFLDSHSTERDLNATWTTERYGFSLLKPPFHGWSEIHAYEHYMDIRYLTPHYVLNGADSTAVEFSKLLHSASSVYRNGGDGTVNPNAYGHDPTGVALDTPPAEDSRGILYDGNIHGLYLNNLPYTLYAAPNLVITDPTQSATVLSFQPPDIMPADHAELHRSTTTPVVGGSGTLLEDNISVDSATDTTRDGDIKYYYVVIYKDVGDSEVTRTQEVTVGEDSSGMNDNFLDYNDNPITLLDYNDTEIDLRKYNDEDI